MPEKIKTYLRTLAVLHDLFVRVLIGKISGAASIQILQHTQNQLQNRRDRQISSKFRQLKCSFLLYGGFLKIVFHHPKDLLRYLPILRHR